MNSSSSLNSSRGVPAVVLVFLFRFSRCSWKYVLACEEVKSTGADLRFGTLSFSLGKGPKLKGSDAPSMLKKLLNYWTQTNYKQSKPSSISPKYFWMIPFHISYHGLSGSPSAQKCSFDVFNSVARARWNSVSLVSEINLSISLKIKWPI